MLTFLESKGFTFESEPNTSAPARVTVQPNTWEPNKAPFKPNKFPDAGPNELQWRQENPNTRAPVYKSTNQSRYPNKEAMFEAALNGTLTASQIAASNKEEEETETRGAVLTEALTIGEADESDFN